MSGAAPPGGIIVFPSGDPVESPPEVVLENKEQQAPWNDALFHPLAEIDSEVSSNATNPVGVCRVSHEPNERTMADQGLCVNEEGLRGAFRKVDEHDTRYITSENLLAFFAARGLPLTREEADNAITFADFNMDGKLDLDEFVSAFLCSQFVETPGGV